MAWLFNSIISGVTSGAGIAYHSGVPEVIPDIRSVRVAQCSVLSIIALYFVFFLLAIVLSLVFRFMTSDYPYWDLQTFLMSLVLPTLTNVCILSCLSSLLFTDLSVVLICCINSYFYLGYRCRDRMVVGFTTTYAISNLRQVGGFLRVLKYCWKWR